MKIVHYSKNRNKTSIQPILKLNSTSFMFNNIFCEVNSKLSTEGGPGGTILISSWKCIFGIHLDIRAITTLYAFYSIIFLSYNHSPEK